MKNPLRFRCWSGALGLLFFWSCEAGNRMDQYNVVWDTPSKNSSESMPVGGHSMGLNVWVEQGDILFYAQQSGCFDENNEYLKLGRIRLTLEPNPFSDSDRFRQELKLNSGGVEIAGETAELKATVSIWVETGRPVVHVEADGNRAFTVHAAYEGWRNEQIDLPDDNKGSRFGCFSYDGYPGLVVRYPDVVAHRDNSVLFYHRNREEQLLFDYLCRQQSLDGVKDQLVNTQQGRTFGGQLSGENFIAAGQGAGLYQHTPFSSWKLISKKPASHHALNLFAHVAQTQTLQAWQRGLDALVEADASTARAETLAWWNAFWARSRLVINPGQGETSIPWTLGRNYQLFRYQLGCNAYGEYPTKFNGGNFTFDPFLVSSKRLNGKPKDRITPDWRAWGGGSFTAQNQRLLYWPMLKTGDFEMMRPQFDLYRRALPTATARVKSYWNHDGCLFTEQMENFGLPIGATWGFTERGKTHRRRSPSTELGVLDNKWCQYHYNSQLEFSYMILEYHRYTGADISAYMEFIKQSLRFYDQHYQLRARNRTGHPLDGSGRLIIYPSTACETYKEATNPSDVIAGLRACLNALLTLDASLLPPDERAYFESLVERVPLFAYGEDDAGHTILKPAQSWDKIANVECPQFYPLFPFNCFDLNVNSPQLFRDTWHAGTFAKGMVQSWHQDGIFFARMRMTNEAAAYNTLKMKSANRRFPTFWGPGHDWVPDHNWGGSGMIGLQEMLMQTLGDQIYLFPAWPKDWDVDFKLHAPHNTVVEGRLVNGRFELLSISPPARSVDVVNLLE